MTTSSRRIARAIATPVIVCGLAASAFAQPMSFTRLGDLTGGQFRSAAGGISPDGSIVVGFSASSNGSEAFRWTRPVGMVGLGDIGTTQSFNSIGTGVSSNGIIVGSGRPSTGGTQAAMWPAGGSAASLGQISGAPAGSSVARGVSSNGSVVVGVSPGTSGFSAPFCWTAGGGMQSLGHFSGPAGPVDFGDAHAVSADGQTIVGRSDGVKGAEAFRWTAATGMVGLGDFAGGSFHSEALAISSNGNVIVGFGNNFAADSGEYEEAFRWTADTGLVGLGDLAGGARRSWAQGASADGSVIIGFSNGLDNNGTAVNQAFVWDAADGMRNLRDLLIAGGVDMTGWALNSVGGISDDGRTICGAGINPSGQTEGWVAVIPAPGGLFIVGGFLLFPRRRWSR